ncbi:hypothetical protein BHM03_00043494 [Ensete ventricosum]|nr:hypothetical protein BHM03_00043494 [Ensete ventricosum]
MRTNSSYMVLKTKGASRHMHLISEKHLTEELRRLNLRRQSWGQKTLARGKRMQRRILLKNMPQCCYLSCHEESNAGRISSASTSESRGGDLIIQRYDRSNRRVGQLQCLYSLKGARQVKGQSRVVFPLTKGNCSENIEVLKQVVERGEEATTTSPEGLNYLKVKRQ